MIVLPACLFVGKFSVGTFPRVRLARETVGRSRTSACAKFVFLALRVFACVAFVVVDHAAAGTTSILAFSTLLVRTRVAFESVG